MDYLNSGFKTCLGNTEHYSLRKAKDRGATKMPTNKQQSHA
jgi:hypothetical protein